MWRIAVVHHGLHSSGPHGGNKLLQDANIAQVLRSHNVDLVISGHDHIYERGLADGLSYLVSGGGGAPVYRVKKAEPTSRRYESVRHFVEASVSGGRDPVRRDAPGRLDDRALRAPQGRRLGLRRRQERRRRRRRGGRTGCAARSAPEPAPPSSRCGCRTAGADGEPADPRHGAPAPRRMRSHGRAPHATRAVAFHAIIAG